MKPGNYHLHLSFTYGEPPGMRALSGRKKPHLILLLTPSVSHMVMAPENCLLFHKADKGQVLLKTRNSITGVVANFYTDLLSFLFS